MSVIIYCMLFWLLILYLSFLSAPEKIFAFNLLLFFFFKKIYNKPVPIISVKSDLMSCESQPTSALGVR